MSKIRYVLGISGGKDSTALAIYLKTKYPQLDIEYYFCDTGKELDETYHLIDNLETFLGKKVERLNAAKGSPSDPFDHFLDLYGGYLPSSNARWCTKVLKLEPFEKFVGDEPVVSFVAIRGDEDREAYISKKSNIQSIFPFRQNIWSEDVIRLVLNNQSLDKVIDLYNQQPSGNTKAKSTVLEIAKRPLSMTYPQDRKLNDLFMVDTKLFNRVVFAFLKTTQYPLGQVESFPMLENDEVLTIDDVFRILKESGVGVPAYYEKIEFELDGKKGHFSRSRSGCYFCFFQQKIEWIWLYEKHPELFEKAMQYEKDGYTWMQSERLEEIIKPERIKQIKKDQLRRLNRGSTANSGYLVDLIQEAEGEGCAACFI
jgi:3'-phosphoadenosine 5'-phosphosulfate sulfotransferase (PAPS reductase)/FAD synthetase